MHIHAEPKCCRPRRRSHSSAAASGPASLRSLRQTFGSASVARLAGTALRRSRYVTVFVGGSTKRVSSSWTLRAVLVAALLLAAVPVSPPLVAQEAEAPAAPDAAADPALRETLEETYEVLPIQGGVLLRPREEYRGIRTLEVTGSGLAVNGEAVSEDEARGWLGERAEPVLELLALDPEERRSLLGLEAEGAPEAGAAEAAEAAEEAEAARAPEVAEPPEPPEKPRRPRVRRGGQTVFGSHVHVAEDEISDDITVFGGSADIDGEVRGNVTVLGGNLRIDGTVTGEATVVGSPMFLGPEADVRGNATAVAGYVHREPGARIGGRIEEVSGIVGPWWIGWDDWTWRPGWSPWWGLTELVVALTSWILLGLLMAVVVALGRDRVERIAARSAREPVKAGVVGVLVTILTLPVFFLVLTLLILTIVGIPIAVALALASPFLAILWVIFALMGFTGVALVVGRWIARRFDRSVESPYAAVFLGLLALAALCLVGDLLDVFGGPVDVFAAMFSLAGFLVQLVAWSVGFGAVFLLLYERRARRRAARAAGYPPPSPPPPPEEG